MPRTERVECADDPRLAAFRGVADPELVRVRHQFIAEGRLVVRRVIEDRRFPVRAVLVNEAARAQLEPVLRTLPQETPVYVGGSSLFVALTGYDIHRGCLALVERPGSRRVEEISAAADTIVALEAVANADNVGAAFRNAVAFGCDAVVLGPGCCDPFYRKAMRTSMAAVLQMPFAVAERWPAELAEMRAAGVALVALTPREPAMPLDAFARERPTRLVLVAGTEGAGLSADVEALATHRVRIPISDAVDSLNVATAIGIALYALRGR
jgi:tRNA G18 (ribose-2'-O)-methylase SpoU